TQADLNLQLCALFYRLAWLSHSGVNAVFVFDGPKRPKVKRGKQVKPIVHRLSEPFKQLIAGYGFHSHTAPGEAEAELAYLNGCGAIDFVMTSDSDIFVFGAHNIIRTGTGKTPGRDNPDEVIVYRTTGSEYADKGLKECGCKAAKGVARHHPGLCAELLEAGKQLRGKALEEFLRDWRLRLHNILKYDPEGLIGMKYRKAVSRLPNIFPDPALLCLYCNPITSQATRGPSNIAYDWLACCLPDTGILAVLCEKFFGWREHDSLINRMHTHIWDGYFIPSTRETSCATSLICHIGKVEYRLFSNSAFRSFQVVVSTLLLMQEASNAIITDDNSAPLPSSMSLGYQMFVWVPEPILQGVAQDVIQEFLEARPEEHLPQPRSPYEQVKLLTQPSNTNY
ncbi:PIN domain-like protein, partial [Agrocybe pediades]